MTRRAKRKALDEAAMKEHERRLRAIAGVLFYGETGDRLEIDPVRSQVLVGVYVAADRLTAKYRKIKPFPDAPLEMVVKYLLMHDEKPLSIVAAPDREEGEIDYVVEDWVTSGRSKTLPLLHWSTLADFSVDDRDELQRTGLPRKYVNAFGDMSTDTRKVYKTAVTSIIDKPPALKSVKPLKFLRTLAGYGTYEPFLGAYFKKWEDEDPKVRAGSAFPTNSTADYVKRNTSEVFLEGGQDYALVTSDQSYQLFQIVRATDGDLTLHEVLGGYDSKHSKVDWKRPRKVVLFHAVDGEKSTKQRSQAVYQVNDAEPQRLILDPRGMVEAVTGGAAGGSLLELNDSFDWFVEMCIAYFPLPFYPINFAGPLQPNPDSLAVLKEEMDATVRYIMDLQGEVGELSEQFSKLKRDVIEAMLKIPTMVMFPQGIKVGPHARLIAADREWVYFRDLDRETVYAVHIFDFVHNYRVGKIATDVYESSRGILPMLGLMFATATVGFGAGVFAVGTASAIGGQLVRKVITDVAVGELTKQAAKRMAKYMAPAIAAYMTKLVTMFFIYAKDDKDAESVAKAKKWQVFAEGFFQGYVVNTLYDQFYRNLILTATAGPKEYRTYKMIKRVYAAIDKAREVIATLEEELDEASIKKGLLQFEYAATHMLQGALLILASLYYTDHADLEGVMEGMSDKALADAPAEELWQFESSVQIAEMAKNLQVQLAALGSIDDVLATLRGSVGIKLAIGAGIFGRDVAKGVVALAKAAGNTKVAKTAGKALTHPTVLKVLGGLLLASGVIHEVSTGGKGTKAVAAGIGDAIKTIEPLLTAAVKEFLAQWPGDSEDRARIHGELTGGMLGAILFNRFLFGTGKEHDAAKAAKKPTPGQWWLKLNDSPVLGSSLRKNLKIGVIGPILKAVFKRYLSLYHELRNGIWPGAPERTEDLLGALLSVGEDALLKERGFERLAVFRSQKETISFSLVELVQVLFRLRNLVGSDLAAYLEMRYKKGDIDPKKFLPDEIQTLIKGAEALGLPDLAAKYGPQLYVVVSTHLYLALNALSEALLALFEPFTKEKKSWMSLLQELGLDVGDLDAVVKELNAAEKDRLAPFKGAQAGTP